MNLDFYKSAVRERSTLPKYGLAYMGPTYTSVDFEEQGTVTTNQANDARVTVVGLSQ